ncbi:MAG: LysR substrate-binding domain-containing protein [Pseudomonadota bacterium]
MKQTFSENELRALDLNALLAFVALMRAGSVRGAAARLGLGAPAVSMALAKLRERLDDPLFVRASGRMAPTDRADALFAAIGPAFEEIHAALTARPSFDPATAERLFRFASPDDLEPALIPRLLARLGAAAPGVQLALLSADFRNAPALLDEGAADLALTATPPALEKRHRSERLHQDRFSAVFDPEQCGRDVVRDLDRYLSVPHLLVSPTGALSGPIDAALARLGRDRRVLASAPRFSTLPFILRSRPCLVNMPSVAAAHLARLFDLGCGPTPFESPTFALSLVWRLESDRDPGLVWLRALITDLVAELRTEAARATP